MFACDRTRLERAALGQSFRRTPQPEFGSGSGSGSSDNQSGLTKDGLWWTSDLEKTSTGHVSFAVLGAQDPCEDQGSIFISPNATFVGLYDGHFGYKAAEHANKFFLKRQFGISRGEGSKLSKEIIKDAFHAAEEAFLNHVRSSFSSDPSVATTGCSCLVALIWSDIIYISILGTPRSAMATINEYSRAQIHMFFADDNSNRTTAHVCKSIGDAALKYPFEFGGENHRAAPYQQSEPKIFKVKTKPNREEFIIFATQGLWEFLSINDAIKIVHENPRSGIAKLLIKSALEIAAARKKMSYEEMVKAMKKAKGTKKVLNEDISVVVVYSQNEKTRAGLIVRYGETSDQRKL